MSASITITVPELASIEAKFAALAQGHADLTPLMDRIGMAMETTTLERFEAEEAPDGSKWQKSQAAKDRGGKTLTLSGRLRQSNTHLAGRDRVEIGTNVIYAGVHQNGFSGAQDVKAHKRTISQAFGRTLKSPIEVIVPAFTRNMDLPAREFLGVSAEDRDEIEGHYDDYILELAA